MSKTIQQKVAPCKQHNVCTRLWEATQATLKLKDNCLIHWNWNQWKVRLVYFMRREAEIWQRWRWCNCAPAMTLVACPLQGRSAPVVLFFDTNSLEVHPLHDPGHLDRQHFTAFRSHGNQRPCSCPKPWRLFCFWQGGNEFTRNTQN